MPSKGADGTVPGSNVGENLAGILRKGDITKSIVSYLKDKMTGALYVTPRMARRNIYRDAFKMALGNKYSQEDADRAADEDYMKALRERYARLRKKFAHMPRFSKDENYAVVPTDAVTPVGNKVYSYGSVNSRVPVKVMERKQGNTLGEVLWPNSRYRSANAALNLYPGPRTDKYTALHEMMHTAVPPYNYDPVVGFLPQGLAGHKDLRYARTPREMMVGVLGEKARLRGEGKKSEGIGDAWISEMTDKIKGGWKPVPIPRNNQSREWMLNIDSLRNIFYETYMNAHRKDASDTDKRNYNLLLNELRDAFRQARNSRSHVPSSGSWMEFYGNNERV